MPVGQFEVDHIWREGGSVFIVGHRIIQVPIQGAGIALLVNNPASHYMKTSPPVLVPVP